MGRGGSKKAKSILALPHVGLKYHLIPVPPLLWGGQNLRRAKQGGAGQNSRPYCYYFLDRNC